MIENLKGMASGFILLVALLIAALIGMALLTQPAHAHTFDRDECQGYAEDAARFVFAHHSGMKLEDAAQKLHDIIVAGQEKGSTYVKDEQDERRIYNTLASAWNLPEQATPGQIMDGVYKGCTQDIGMKSEMPPGIEKHGPQLGS